MTLRIGSCENSGPRLALALVLGLIPACSGQEDDSLESGKEMDSGAADSGQAREDAGPRNDAGSQGDGDGDGDQPGDGDGDGVVGGDGDAGSDDSGVPDVIVNGLYVSPGGLDENAGTETAPYLTLAKAASMATAGSTIVLLDGDYDSTTQPTFTQFNSQRIDVADGVTVRALHPGAAVLHGVKGYLLRFLGSGTVRGLTIDGFSTSIVATQGNLTIRETKFLVGGSNSGFPIELSGTAHATITPPSDGNYIGGASHNGFVNLQDSAEATITGGRFSGATTTGVTCNVLFAASETSKLVLDGITTDGNAQDAVLATEQADVTIRDSTLKNTTGTCNATVLLHGTPKLHVQNTIITESKGYGIIARNNASSNVTIDLVDTTITKSASHGMFFEFTDTVTLTALRSHFDDNGAAGVHNRGAGNMTFTQCSFDGNATDGLAAQSGSTHVFTVKARGSSFQDNTQNGVNLNADNTSAFDFGKVSDAGGNTFDGNGGGNTSFSNFLSAMPSGHRVFAVGNTWEASAQGASAQGTYAATGAGANLEFTGATTGADRSNYIVSMAGSILRVAENP